MSDATTPSADLIPVAAIERRIAEISAADALDQASAADLEQEWHLMKALEWWRRDRHQAEKDKEAAG